MAESKMPARIWATCNGMSTRLPDGHRQFIGGWSEDKDRPRAERFIRADLVEPLVEALRAHDAYMAENFSDGPDSKALHPKAAANWKRVRAALSSWEAAQ